MSNKEKLPTPNEAIKTAFEDQLVSADLESGRIYDALGNELRTSLYKDNGGYVTVLNWPIRASKIYLHRALGYKIWKEEMFKKGLVVHHIDGIRNHNFANNLQLIPHGANIRHSIVQNGFYVETPSGELVGSLTDKKYVDALLEVFPELRVRNTINRVKRWNNPKYLL